MNVPFPRRCPRRLAGSVSLVLVVSLLSSGSIGCDAAPTSSAPPSPSASGPHDQDHGHAGHGATITDSQLILTTKPTPPEAGERTTIRVMIHSADGSMVREFDTLHEKKLHLILIREGLDEFAHLHPEVDDAGNAKIEYAFPVGGRYFVYADHQPAGEGPATAKATIEVGGESPAAPKLAPDVPGRVSGDGLTADVAIEETGEGESRSIIFSLSDLEGKPVSDLENYLGALGHLVIVSADGQEYVHAHPEDGRDATDGGVAFDAHFTKPGLYKGWGQFQRAGEVLTVPFVARID